MNIETDKTEISDLEEGETLETELKNYHDPMTLFQKWFELAKKKEINDPNAMALATVDSSGMPNVRMVLLKGTSKTGFTFYTNYESSKGQEILHNMKVALCFHWKSIRRQIRVRGPVEQVSSQEADAYFNSRPLGSRVGAWASQQSRPLESRFALEKRVAEYTAKYATGNVPRPEHWSGFTLQPLEVEFWQDRKFRLHDRFVFRRNKLSQSWTKTRLYP